MCHCELHTASSVYLCASSLQYPAARYPFSLSQYLWNEFSDPVLDGVELASFNCSVNSFLQVYAARFFLSSTIFPRFFLSMDLHCELGSSD